MVTGNLHADRQFRPPGLRSFWWITILRRPWPVWVVALLIVAAGSVNIAVPLSVSLPARPEILDLAVPLDVHRGARSLSVAAGFALIVLGVEVLRQRRLAWWLALVLLSVAAVTDLASVQYWEGAAVPLLALPVLLRYRHLFFVRSDPRPTASGLKLLAVILAGLIVYGTAGFGVLGAGHFSRAFSPVDAFVETFRTALHLGGGVAAETRTGAWFRQSFDLLGGLFVAFLVLGLFRPVRYHLLVRPGDHAAVAYLLDRFGRAPVDFFKLWPDKSHLFLPGGASCVSYGVAFHTAVALGDPLGVPAQDDAMVAAFIRFCRANGWSSAIHQASESLVPLYRAHGYHTIKIGEEGIVDLDRFVGQTSQARQFRRVARRFGSAGYQLQRHDPPHPAGLLDEVEAVSEAWLTLPGRAEHSFTLGRFERNYLNTTALYVLREPSHPAIAFVNQIPAYRPGQATIDLLRHPPEAPNGTMDFLFLSLFRRLHQDGYRSFSLGLAPLAGVGDRPGETLEEWLVQLLYERSGSFSAGGLRQYKTKFDPTWENRYLMYQGGLPGLVWAGLAVARLAGLLPRATVPRLIPPLAPHRLASLLSPATPPDRSKPSS